MEPTLLVLISINLHVNPVAHQILFFAVWSRGFFRSLESLLFCFGMFFLMKGFFLSLYGLFGFGWKIFLLFFYWIYPTVGVIVFFISWLSLWYKMKYLEMSSISNLDLLFWLFLISFDFHRFIAAEDFWNVWNLFIFPFRHV